MTGKDLTPAFPIHFCKAVVWFIQSQKMVKCYKINQFFFQVQYCTWIVWRFSEIAVDGFDFVVSHDGKQSAFFVANLLEVPARGRDFSNRRGGSILCHNISWLVEGKTELSNFFFFKIGLYLSIPPLNLRFCSLKFQSRYSLQSDVV